MPVLHQMHVSGNCYKVRLAARQAGVALQLRDYGLHDGETRRPEFLAKNPNGRVPTLELDDGTTFTEVAVLLQVIADRKPGALAPEVATMERYRLNEWLNFIATEIHKGYNSLWHPELGEAAVAGATATLKKRYAVIETQLGKTPYLTGDAFTIADAYLFTVTNWSNFLKLDLSDFPNLQAFMKRVAARPGVVAAMKAERLIK